MNAIVPATNGSSAGLVPQNFDQAMRFAEMMARSKMVPKHFQNKPEECLVIIEQAMRWEMSPYAVIQCAAMIHERPMYEGKLVAAVVNSRGPHFGLQGRLRYHYEGTGPLRKVTVSGTLDGKEETIEVLLKDAQTSNEHWKKQPDQQLAYHGARVWARRHMPELMLGVYAPEEFDRTAAPVADNFTGTTLEAEPVPQGQPRDTARAIGDELPPSATSAAPKRQTNAEWLLAVQADLEAAKTADAVDLIVASEKVQKALDTFTNAALHTLNGLIAKAQARTAPADTAAEDTWPGPTPESMRADREAAA